MNIMSLINALPGAAAQGLIWGIMAIGVYLTFRILDVADLTVDGTMCTGGAVCVMMLMSGHNIWVSMLAATGAGMLAGLATGIFHTFMGIPAILAGILTQLGLYSANLKIMGKANQAVNGNKYNLLVSLRNVKNVPILSEHDPYRSCFYRCSDRDSLLVLRNRTWMLLCVLPDVIQICPVHRASTQMYVKYLD